MSDSNSDHSANPTPDEGAGPDAALPHVESPSMAPDEQSEAPAEPPVESPKREISVPARAAEPTALLAATRGTALVLTLPRPEETTAGPAAEPAGPKAKSKRFAFMPAAASMVAVLLSAAVGAGATAGLLYLNAAQVAAPADPMTFTAALGQIDHELATLKLSIEGSAKQSSAQIGKIADRMDRAEKTQADTSAKLARTTESLDRLDHRLAGNGSAAGPGEATGSLPPGPVGRTATLADPGRPGAPAPAPVLEGWVLRDVFNGGAMIQSPRNGILEVIPGDSVPGLGRIEGIRRQDGHWVVLTSRGLIVSR